MTTISDPSIPLATIINATDIFLIDQVDPTSITGYRTKRARGSALVAISVKNFGAVGDGVTDDTDAIQAGINALASFPNGGTLYFPATTAFYKITGTLNVDLSNVNDDFNVKLRGDGNTASQVILSTATGISILNAGFVSPTGTLLVLEDIGFATSGAGSGASGNNGIFLNNCNAAIFNRVSFNFCQIGVFLENSFSARFYDCNMANNADEAIYFSDTSSQNSIISGGHYSNNGSANSVPQIYYEAGGYNIIIDGPTIDTGYGGILFNGCAGVTIRAYIEAHSNFHVFWTGTGNAGFEMVGCWFGSNKVGGALAVTATNVTGVRFEYNTLFEYQQSWGSTATQIKVGVCHLLTGASVGSGANTFSTLPAASAALEGQMYPVTDSTTATWRATITGGGSNHVLAYCNGTNWTVAA